MLFVYIFFLSLRTRKVPARAPVKEFTSLMSKKISLRDPTLVPNQTQVLILYNYDLLECVRTVRSYKFECLT